MFHCSQWVKIKLKNSGTDVFSHKTTNKTSDLLNFANNKQVIMLLI